VLSNLSLIHFASRSYRLDFIASAVYIKGSQYHGGRDRGVV
jgi:hypothetical protein